MPKQILLTRGQFSIVDDEDFDYLNQWKWNCTKQGYAVRLEGAKRSRITIHQKLLNPPSGYDIDHINGDKLDNRRSNLRICTRAQNSRNQKKRTGLYKGVSWNKSKNKWIAQICFDYKNKHLGNFTNPIDAAKAYNEAALKYHGEFAYQNTV